MHSMISIRESHDVTKQSMKKKSCNCNTMIFSAIMYLIMFFLCFLLWWRAGELFTADGRMKEAQFCVQEAGTLFPASHSVLLLKGHVAELRGNDMEAKSLYDEALAINPRGHHILLHLVSDTCCTPHTHTHTYMFVYVYILYIYIFL